MSVVIRGTHNPHDLIPAFVAELDRRDPVSLIRIRNQYGAFVARAGREHEFTYPTISDGTRLVLLLEDLEDALDYSADPGYYFGLPDGGGSDYGFYRGWE